MVYSIILSILKPFNNNNDIISLLILLKENYYKQGMQVEVGALFMLQLQ